MVIIDEATQALEVVWHPFLSMVWNLSLHRLAGFLFSKPRS